MSVLEAVAWIAGEPWSDEPERVSPVIADFMRCWSSDLRDEERQLLVPLIPRVIDTRSTLARARIEEKRAWMAVDWVVRVQTPTWLELAGIDDHAAILRELPEISDSSVKDALASIEEAIREATATWNVKRNGVLASARDAAWRAVDDAALFAADQIATGDVAFDSARPDACSVARSAAYYAACDASCDAAYVAVRGTAGDASYAAAREAADSALRPTVEQLQQSALELLDRLIKVGGTH